MPAFYRINITAANQCVRSIKSFLIEQFPNRKDKIISGMQDVLF